MPRKRTDQSGTETQADNALVWQEEAKAIPRREPPEKAAKTSNKHKHVASKDTRSLLSVAAPANFREANRAVPEEKDLEKKYLELRHKRIRDLIEAELPKASKAAKAALRSQFEQQIEHVYRTGKAPAAWKLSALETNAKKSGTRGGKVKSTPKKQKVPLPQLPKGLSWPKETFADARTTRSEDLEQFLERVWLPLIRAGFGELRWLRQIDPSAIDGIKNFGRSRNPGVRRSLPDHLRFLTESEVNDRAIAQGGAQEDVKLARAAAYRLSKGIKVPST